MKTKEEDILVEQIHVRMHPGLRRIIEAQADSSYPMTMNDIIVRILAEYYGKPEYSIAPKKRMGRPRKQPA